MRSPEKQSVKGKKGEQLSLILDVLLTLIHPSVKDYGQFFLSETKDLWICCEIEIFFMDTC